MLVTGPGSFAGDGENNLILINITGEPPFNRLKSKYAEEKVSGKGAYNRRLARNGEVPGSLPGLHRCPGLCHRRGKGGTGTGIRDCP